MTLDRNKQQHHFKVHCSVLFIILNKYKQTFFYTPSVLFALTLTIDDDFFLFL